MNDGTLLHSPPANRRHPLLEATPSPAANKIKRYGEVAGATAAECTAICCCCPCTIINLLILTVYRLPAGLCRKALRKHKRRKFLKRQSLLPPLQQRSKSMASTIGARPEGEAAKAEEGSRSGDAEAVDLEEEMMERFYGTGFWRSLSQRDC